MIGNLLINEPPLQVLPTLAKAIGLNEAIITQQVHYWLQRSKNQRDGFTWVYKTYDEWQEEFPFWSVSTIKRIISSLEKQKILLSTSKYNKMPMDRTKWYTLDYSTLQRQPLAQNDTMHQLNMTSASVQNDTMQSVKMTPAITRDYTEITTETNTQTTVAPNEANLFAEIVATYEKCFGLVSPFVGEELDYIFKSYNKDLINEAIKETAQNKNVKKPIKYITKILTNWHNENIRSLHDLEAVREEREQNGRISKNDGKAKSQKPNIFGNYCSD